MDRTLRQPGSAERPAAPSARDVPDPTVHRLSAYMRKLEDLAARGIDRVSSRELAEFVKAGPDMVRRDLSMFGQFGRPGRGYDVRQLMGALRRILGTDVTRKVIIVGVGDLGRALLRYPEFAPRGFEFVAGFDSDPEKVGRRVRGVPVLGMDRLEEVVQHHGISLAVLTVPPGAAEAVASRLHQAGISGILNFASLGMVPIDGITVTHVDISGCLEYLAFRTTP